jgi:uncharacterized protein
MSVMLVVTALLMGFLGSSHCVVMCGGVVAMSCSALPLARRGTLRAQLPYVLSYNAGRIASYAAAGALVGAVGAGLGTFGPVSHALLVLRLVAGLMMIAVGFYLAGWGRPLRWMERAGEPMWRRIAPLARKLVPVRTPWQAAALGLVWGWMPCGLVYAALAASVTSGSSLGGAVTMGAFGLGTLPMLVAMGSAAALVTRLARSRLRFATAVAIALFGFAQVAHAGATWTGGHDGHPTCCAGHSSLAVGPR